MDELMLDAFYSVEPLFLLAVHSIVPNVLLHGCPEYASKNGTQQQQRKPPNGSNFFSGHINGMSPNLLGQISGKKTKHCQDH